MHGKRPVPSQINISVVAPLMMVSNMLCLYYDSEIFYVLASSGYISQFYKVPDELKDYESLTKLNLKEFFETVQIYETQSIPEGYITLNETDNEVRAFSITEFLKEKDLNLASKLTEDDWNKLIEYGKITGKLNELHTYVTQIKIQSIESEKQKLESTFDLKYVKQRDEIISKIVEFKVDEKNNEDELKQLRQQLSEISDQAKIEELEYLNYVTENLQKTRRFWNDLLSLMHEQQKGTFTINDLRFKSNRARRAEQTTMDENEYLEAINILDHRNVPTFPCTICMNQGPFVLWLKEPTNVDDTTSDFVLNCPLEVNKNVMNCIVSNPVCGYCAKPYINTMMKNSNPLTTVYREPCAGFIPLNWSIKSNCGFARHALFKILTQNKALEQVKMLLLAAVDDFNADWIDQNFKDYFIKQLADHIYTKDSFSEEGTTMKFLHAIKEIIKQEDKLMRLPFNTVCRILKFNVAFHHTDTELIQTLLSKRFALMCIESICRRAKPDDSSSFITLQRKIYDAIFETFCGIPFQNSLKPIAINNQRLRYFLGKFFDISLGIIEKIAECLNIDCSMIIPKETVSYILYIVTTIEKYDKPHKLYNDICLKHRLFRDNMKIEWSEFEQMVNKELFPTTHVKPSPFIPGYAVNLGRFSCPSKLFFNNEPLWDENIKDTRINATTLMEQLKTNLHKILNDRYGSRVPDEFSSHFLLHRIIADIIETHYPNEEVINEEMVIDCMLKLRESGEQKKGNVHANYIFTCVALTIEDYLRFRKTTKNMLIPDKIRKSCTYEYKMRAELISSGMTYDENTNEILFEPSKLKVPHIIDIDNPEKDLNDFKQRVRKLYIDKNKYSNETKPTQNTANVDNTNEKSS